MNLVFDGPEHSDHLLAFAHGAGAPMDSDFMNTIARGLAAAEIRVVRFEFPYMERRRLEGRNRPPDRQPVLLDRWCSVIEQLGGGPALVIAGKSMGGRMASLIADEIGVRGAICLGYPFHPPGKPEKLRTAHLENLQTPTLILQGERDPFGKPEEVAGYPLSANIAVHWLKDGDHSFKPRVKSGRALEDNLTEAVATMTRFIRSLG